MRVPGQPRDKPTVTADKEDPSQGHTFLITYQSKGSYKVIGDTDYTDEKEHTGPAHFCEVRAWNLRDALIKAAHLSFEDLMTNVCDEEEEDA